MSGARSIIRLSKTCLPRNEPKITEIGISIVKISISKVDGDIDRIEIPVFEQWVRERAVL
jgi:hypothetical protein